MKELKAYLRWSLIAFCPIFFLNTRSKNGEKYELPTISSFQRFIQRYLTEKEYPFNILKDNELEKSKSVVAAERKSPVHEHGNGTEHATSRLGD